MRDSRHERSRPIPEVVHDGNRVVKMSGFNERGRRIGVWRTFDRTGRLVKEADFSIRG